MNYRKTVEEAWENREELKKQEVRDIICEVVDQLDRGVLRVAEKIDDQWVVNDWIKKAVILYFPTRKMETIELPPF